MAIEHDDPIEWARLARRAAAIMVQAVRLRAARKSTRGLLAPYLRQLDTAHQIDAATDLRAWVHRHFGRDAQATAIADDLLGVDVITITDPALRGRVTNGRWAAPGLDDACRAVDALIRHGVDERTARRRVAAKIRRHWKDSRWPALHHEIGDQYARLDRVLYDAYRNRHRKKMAPKKRQSAD